MLVKVAVIIEDVAFGFAFWVASGTSCFLNVIFQRVGNVIVNHHAHVFLVDTHAKGGCGHHGHHPVGNEIVLVGDFLVGVHFTVKRQSLDSIVGKSLGKLGAFPST